MPIYRIKELIYEKYGEHRFALGCEIVARWMAFETKKPWTHHDVLSLCHCDNYHELLTIKNAQLLANLLNLNGNLDLLCTNPQPTAAEYFTP